MLANKQKTSVNQLQDFEQDQPVKIFEAQRSVDSPLTQKLQEKINKEARIRKQKEQLKQKEQERIIAEKKKMVEYAENGSFC